MVVWFVTQSPEDRGNKFLRNIGNYLQDHTVTTQKAIMGIFRCLEPEF
jgi:hypothetical protein